MTAPALDRRGWRYALFFSIYLSQGTVAGFSLTALANHYAALGLSAAEVGRHFALVGLPWALQPLLWGPLVDRGARSRMGRRRFWAVAAIAGAHLALAGLLFLPDERAIAAVGLVFLCHSVFAALLDTAADRLIIDHVPGFELGRMSACTRAGFVSGTAASAALFSWLLATEGFRFSVAVLIGLSLLASLPALIVREAPGDDVLSLRRQPETVGDAPSLGRAAVNLLASLKRREIIVLLAVCFAIEFATTAFDIRLGVDMVQVERWDPAALSRLQAGLAFASGTLGAVLIGAWSDRAGAVTTLFGLFALCAAAYGAAAGLLALDLAGSAGAVILGLSSIVPALLYVALVPALMQASRGAAAATQFELSMALMNFGDVVGAAASGAVTGLLGLGRTALCVAAVFLVCALLARRRALLAPSTQADAPALP